MSTPRRAKHGLRKHKGYRCLAPTCGSTEDVTKSSNETKAGNSAKSGLVGVPFGRASPRPNRPLEEMYRLTFDFNSRCHRAPIIRLFFFYIVITYHVCPRDISRSDKPDVYDVVGGRIHVRQTQKFSPGPKPHLFARAVSTPLTKTCINVISEASVDVHLIWIHSSLTGAKLSQQALFEERSIDHVF